MNYSIRKMIDSDKDIVFSMMKSFYNSDAVFTNGSTEIYNADIDACLSDSPYIEGYAFIYDNRVIGYGMIAKSFSTEFGKPCIWIEDIYIDENHRSNGLGTMFIKYIDSLYPNAIKRLEAEKENEHALHVYHKNGFSELPYIELKK